MPTPPSIVFCTTCKNRVEHLRQTLPANLRDNSDYENCRFVVLDYGDSGGLRQYLLSDHASDIESGRLIVYQTTADKFHMAHAKNMAHRCGILEDADILVNLDADGFTGSGFAQYIADQFNEHGRDILLQAMWNRWVDVDGTEQWLAQEPDGSYGPPVPKGSNGRMAVTASAFLKAGGYNEKYGTWGPDDKDFNIRLRRLGYVPKEIARKHLATILHNDKVRFRDYPHAAGSKAYEFKISIHDSDETIVNFGNIGTGEVFRNFGSEPITLEPLPTRIFGIGMHKTATTSLHRALRVLGFDSAHWKDAHWAKAIWKQINESGKSLTLEKHYALSDLPVPLLYEKLDRAYPGSKFILTVRDERRWLKSVENHWNPVRNPFRHQWDTDPFTHRVHRMLYGRMDFEASIFLECYRRHNAEVIEYFRNRPSDLLIMNMDAEAGWKELCGFLGAKVPNVPYPTAFKTEDYNQVRVIGGAPSASDHWADRMQERFRDIFGEIPPVAAPTAEVTDERYVELPDPPVVDTVEMGPAPGCWIMRMLRLICGWLMAITGRGKIKLCP